MKYVDAVITGVLFVVTAGIVLPIAYVAIAIVGNVVYGSPLPSASSMTAAFFANWWEGPGGAISHLGGTVAAAFAAGLAAAGTWWDYRSRKRRRA